MTFSNALTGNSTASSSSSHKDNTYRSKCIQLAYALELTTSNLETIKKHCAELQTKIDILELQYLEISSKEKSIIQSWTNMQDAPSSDEQTLHSLTSKYEVLRALMESEVSRMLSILSDSTNTKSEEKSPPSSDSLIKQKLAIDNFINKFNEMKDELKVLTDQCNALKRHNNHLVEENNQLMGDTKISIALVFQSWLINLMSQCNLPNSSLLGTSAKTISSTHYQFSRSQNGLSDLINKTVAQTINFISGASSNTVKSIDTMITEKLPYFCAEWQWIEYSGNKGVDSYKVREESLNRFTVFLGYEKPNFDGYFSLGIELIFYHNNSYYRCYLMSPPQDIVPSSNKAFINNSEIKKDFYLHPIDRFPTPLYQSSDNEFRKHYDGNIDVIYQASRAKDINLTQLALEISQEKIANCSKSKSPSHSFFRHIHSVVSTQNKPDDKFNNDSERGYSCTRVL